MTGLLLDKISLEEEISLCIEKTSCGDDCYDDMGDDFCRRVVEADRYVIANPDDEDPPCPWCATKRKNSGNDGQQANEENPDAVRV